MGLKVYLPLAIIVSLLATTGADVIARTSIEGQPLSVALHEDLYWAGVQFIATMLLLAPFVGVAIVCDRMEKRVRTRSVFFIFTAAMLALLYFYFQGYESAEHAVVKRMWTAATLSVAMLPFFIGIPVVLAVIGAGALGKKFDPLVSNNG